MDWPPDVVAMKPENRGRAFSSASSQKQGSAKTRRLLRGGCPEAAARSRRRGALPWRKDPFLEIALEAFAGFRRLGVLRKMRVVDAVDARYTERPGAARRLRRRGDIDGGHDARGEQLVLEHVAFALFLERNQADLRSVCSRSQF